MFNILVVDDEKIERDGVRLLINKFGMDLNVFEAENGEAALEILESSNIDILLTDIKMPFMDGIELCRISREKYSDIKMIILSAYGEFEYAKSAINFNAFYYLLKPIELREFETVVTQCIELCINEKIEKEKNRILLEAYQEGIEYHKEKILLELISGEGNKELLQEELEEASIHFNGYVILPILLDFRNKFFDTYDRNFRNIMNELLKTSYEYLNINETQSLLFLKLIDNIDNKQFFYSLGEGIKNTISDLYGQIVTIVIGKPAFDVYKLAQEYNALEAALEYKFYFNDCMVLFSDGEYTKEILLPGKIDELVSNINRYIEIRDFFSLENAILLFFNTIKGNEDYPEVYLKYICANIVKNVVETSNQPNLIKDYVEVIFKFNNINELKNYLVGLIKEIRFSVKGIESDESKRVIRNVIHIIEENYMNDIGIEWIAEKVFLSPSYLSFLFKKSTGNSIIKYMTTYRLEKAKEFLNSTNMKITEISRKVGYMNDSYFCLSFKKEFGFSPAKFREMEV